ncbi:hypothetical protein GUJ93_ZPchr0006g40665 [Zizania palustris]|uniref:Uncharacterized protein n=1 Tax=Zizania palustris TaxID=103762 RepID=A0A8J5TF25_ZIZPA|nr:hypothetical protein GUJ93_ZPchr0006g40665 [Zizania palustris]
MLAWRSECRMEILRSIGNNTVVYSVLAISWQCIGHGLSMQFRNRSFEIRTNRGLFCLLPVSFARILAFHTDPCLVVACISLDDPVRL